MYTLWQMKKLFMLTNFPKLSAAKVSECICQQLKSKDLCIRHHQGLWISIPNLSKFLTCLRICQILGICMTVRKDLNENFTCKNKRAMMALDHSVNAMWFVLPITTTQFVARYFSYYTRASCTYCTATKRNNLHPMWSVYFQMNMT